MKHFITRFEEASRANWTSPALCDYNGRSFRYCDVCEQIARLHLLFREMGVQSGDKVVINYKNTATWCIAYLALTSYRAVAVPILLGFTPESLEGLIRHSDSVLIFTEDKIWDELDPEHMPRLRGAIDADNYTVLYSSDGKLNEAYNGLNGLFTKEYPAGFTKDSIHYEVGKDNDLITINYTSGTTSSPKGIMLSACNISANITFGIKRIGMPHGSTIVSMLPMAHMYGLAFEFLYPISQGCCIYLLGKMPTPSVLMKAFADVKPYMLITVPMVVEKIFRGKVIPILSKPHMRALTSIPFVRGQIYGAVRKKVMNAFGGNMKHIILGGAAVNGNIEMLMKKIKIPFTVGYGMTECAPLIGYEDWYNFVPHSCGKPVDCTEVRIDSEDPQNIVGEIQVRGENVMLGYYNDPEATAAAFTNDKWMRTGDLGLMDADKNIFIKGRMKNMILSSNGQNIYPEEIEEILNAMPNVNDSIAIGRNGRIIAIVSVANNDAQPLSEDEIKTVMKHNLVALNAKLPAYGQVAEIELIEGDFERTPKNSIKRFLYK